MDVNLDYPIQTANLNFYRVLVMKGPLLLHSRFLVTLRSALVINERPPTMTSETVREGDNDSTRNREDTSVPSSVPRISSSETSVTVTEQAMIGDTSEEETTEFLVHRSLILAWALKLKNYFDAKDEKGNRIELRDQDFYFADSFALLLQLVETGRIQYDLGHEDGLQDFISLYLISGDWIYDDDDPTYIFGRTSKTSPLRQCLLEDSIAHDRPLTGVKRFYSEFLCQQFLRLRKMVENNELERLKDWKLDYSYLDCIQKPPVVTAGPKDLPKPPQRPLRRMESVVIDD
ncbi:hypothetical protein M501DRAFT_990930 [Patellaria atrata CBS 101060]|uniref:BTB domain-containing protein n=1 Tax=Patellaria atrata CBS 101060 TaxID=1346257 RepID=A0A9P4SEB1_9PEZI|nr:hypothetical protein M501DRAFT_990930 [Patellaria atrata CBS 101060]